MFSFEGNFKAKRNINLGGARKEGKDVLLRRAQQERQARERERERNRAATTIQKYLATRSLISACIGEEANNVPETTLYRLFTSLAAAIDGRSDTSQSELYLEILGNLGELAGEGTATPGSALTRALADSLDSGVLQSLTFRLNEADDRAESDTFLLVCRVLDALVSGADTPAAYRAYARDVLAACILPRAPADSPERQTALPLSVLRNLTISDGAEWVATLSPVPAARLLANLVTLLPPALTHNPGDESNLLRYTTVLQCLLPRTPAPRTAVIREQPAESDTQSDSDSDGAPPLTPAKSGARSTLDTLGLPPTTRERLSARLATVYGPDHLRLFAPLLQGNPAGLLEFLATLMSAWPAVKDSVAHFMLYDRAFPLIRHLWQKLSVCPAWLEATAVHPLTLTVLRDPALATPWLMFYLLCEALSRYLLTASDDDVLDARIGHLVPAELASVGLHARNVAFALLWHESAMDPATTLTPFLSATALRDVTVKLVGQLHDLDGRHRFTPPDHWLVQPELDVAAIADRLAAYHFDQLAQAGVQAGAEGRDEGAVGEPDRWSSSAHHHHHHHRAGPPAAEAALRSRWAILTHLPFVVRFEHRVQVFRALVYHDQQVLGIDTHMPSAVRATIRRGHIFQDGFAQLHSLGAQLKRRIAISFVDQFGLEEAGVDGGGVFKEFFNLLAREAFDPDYGFFLYTADQLLYPNPHSYARQSAQLAYYTFLGRLLGKALYQGIVVEVGFAAFFLNKCLGRTNYLNDLASLDPELYQGLQTLRNYPGDVETDFSLNFAVSDQAFGRLRTVELIPGGADVAVTRANRVQYIYRMANYRLNVQMQQQCRAFFHGLADLIPATWLRLFGPHELQTLISGAAVPIDLVDLQAHTVYAGDYTADHPVIQSFWRVLRSFDETDKQRLLRFVTSCSRPPLLGFKEISPKPCVRSAGSESADRLPTASTCVNLLKLPPFPDDETMRTKLLYAIRAESGFDLS
ncbi:ubiquitin-protein ligase (E3) [Tieghemiomyces parasiticus]|uniref:HECT-type E3 ubiquitin transferase n=1 Tax=Tieghemiomyces parasiticus TaxID=78921 RepID=A0A9W7ZQ40_9FUNG|nr:ubiquitin-protein ligase (E3) [Tieghemiomyces parasiticus]